MKTLPCALAVCLVLAASPPASAGLFQRGNVNADGVTDISDSIALLNFLFIGGGAPSCRDAADVNDDGTIDISDAIRLLGFLFLGSSQPPVPFHDCGEDPTADDLECELFAPCAGDPSGLTLLAATSPADGEEGVAVTREAIIEFTGPIDPSSPWPDAIVARFSGSVLDARYHVSAGSSKVSLFWLDDLPPSALVEVTIDGDLILDDAGRAVDADGDGRPGGTSTVEFSTLTLTVVEGRAAVFGRVFASELGDGGMNVPLAGVTITVDGMEEELRAISDAGGNFRLDPAPAGRFFVHIDGRTATNDVPEGAYYPVVGKAWTANLGEEGGTNVGDIYLPLVAPGTLQPVSAVEDTEVRFPESVLSAHPELEGVAVIVPADSLFSDDGSRGGMVGIAPVDPERLPGELPAGLEFPIVITVQTDGATNFDVPAPICLPNLPDPETGEALPPGARSALWSFNHDTGRFEVVGPMTVSDDGATVCTDPGVGILAPGWHGSNPGTPGDDDPSGPGDGDDGDGDCSLPQALAKGASFLKSIVGLASEFLPVLKGLKCAVAVVDTVAKLAENIESVLKRETVSCAVLGDLKASIEAAAGLLDCVPGIKVVSRLNDLCGRAQDIVGLFSAGGELYKCLKGRSSLFDRILGWVNTIKDYLGVAVNFKQRFLGLVDPRRQLISVLSDLAGKLDKAICEGGGAGDGGAEVVLDGETRDLLGRTAAELRKLSAGLTDLDPAELDFLTERTQTIKRQNPFAGKSLIDALGGQPVRTAYFGLVSYEGLEFRRTYRGRFGFIFPPETLVRVELYNPLSKRFADVELMTEPSGFPTHLGQLVFLPEESPVDSDDDGLSDRAEAVIGTRPDVADTDGDGLLDGAEVRQGTDPLEGAPSPTGIIASVDTPGIASDVCAINDIAIVADGPAGVSVFNVFEGLEPTIVRRIDTPGFARAVACSGAFAAVADGVRGVAVIDVRDPARARIRRYLSWQILGGGDFQAVATAGDLAYAGSTSGSVAAIDMPAGSILERQQVSGRPVQDVALGGDWLYVLDDRELHALRISDAGLQRTSSVAAPGIIGAGRRRRRLFVAGALAYATHTQGYALFRLDDPGRPALVSNCTTRQFGWKYIVSNGAGLGIAAVSPNSTDDGPHHISLYDLSTPGDCAAFRATIETPGLAASLSLYNALAYVADSRAGLQVIRYLPLDAAGEPPQVELAAPFDADASVDEGKRVRVSAIATDDVQVKNVEFWKDGVKVLTDGNEPFEYHFVTPLAREQRVVELRARATDTGGNASWTPAVQVTIEPERIPPEVTLVSPPNEATEEDVRSVTVFFSEPLDAASVVPGVLRVVAAGADGIIGTADDAPVEGGELSYSEDTASISLTFPGALPPGLFGAELAGSPAVTDLAGNALAGPFSWSFEIARPPFRYFVGPAEAAPGGIAEVEVFIDNDEPIQAWSFGLCHDGAELDLVGVEPGEEVLEVKAGRPADFLKLDEAINGDGLAMAVVVDFAGVELLPARLTHLVAKGRYEVVAADGTAQSQLCFCDGLELARDRPVDVIFTIAGRDVDPVTECGTVRIR